MKRTCRYSIATFLFSLSTLLLCLSSCQSSDNTKTGEGVMVASLPLKAQIEDTSSRVGMTDSYNGLFSCYWNLDALNIYHQYVLNGTVQSMMSLPFSTTAISSRSATFSYTGTGAYMYNPGYRFYAFSSNTSGGYTVNMTGGGESTLSASLASQKGTLTDCATYDALYGSANVNSNPVLPGTLTMHHLFGMLNLHLTSNTFSTTNPVTVALTSSALNILPGNGGTATLNTDGSTLTTDGKWSTSWSAAVTPTTNGVVDVYLMTWPFSSISGSTLNVSCSDGSGNTYEARGVALTGLSLAAANVKSKQLMITNTTYSKLYAWDATDSKPITLGTAPTDANNIAGSGSNYNNQATHVCANCPDYYAITWYLKAGCYWDNGSISGGNTTSYRKINGSTTMAGMWFKKKVNITGFSTTSSSGTTSCTPTMLSTMTASAISALNLSTNYFFLPAAGGTPVPDGQYTDGYGDYWSSTPNSDTTLAYRMYFTDTNVNLYNTVNRGKGMCLWWVQ